MTNEEQLELLAEKIRIAEERERRLSTDRRALFRPNAKQWEFCCSQATETFLTGPNQYGGKTYTLRYLISIHATGDYPPEWEGPRYDYPPVILVLSKSRDANRDQIVHHLFSEVYDMEMTNGPGWIRPEEYDKEDLHNVARSLVSARVKHKGPDGEINGKSVLYFLSYDMGWRRIAGYTADLSIGNETPPMHLYTEMKARINMGTKRGGRPRLYIGACPLEEDPEVYVHFRDSSDGKHMKLIDYTIDDCTHLSEEEYEDAFIRWGKHPEAEARLYGRPCRAGGLVFPYPVENWTCPPGGPMASDEVVIGLDFPHTSGYFASTLLAIDRSRDVYRVTDEYKMAGQEAPVNAHRVRLMGGDVIPCAWPKDGGMPWSRNDVAGETIAEKYRKLGLRLTYDRAFFWQGSKKSDEKMVIVQEMQERIATGRLFVSQSCPQLIQELRNLRHKNGRIVDSRSNPDDLFDSLCKAMMMAREAVPYGKAKEATSPRGGNRLRGDYDFYGLG